VIKCDNSVNTELFTNILNRIGQTKPKNYTSTQTTEMEMDYVNVFEIPLSLKEIADIGRYDSMLYPR